MLKKRYGRQEDCVTVAIATEITFSVIVPVYNSRRTIEACIDSIRTQHFQDFELIIVDDGSTDNCTDQFAGSTDLIVLTKDNQGPGSARNCGARIARGDYLFFIDSDDLAPRWALSCFAEALARGDRPAIICGNFVEFCDVAPALEYCPPDIVEYQDYLEAAAAGLYAAGGMVAVRRDIFVEVGGFDETMKVAEDHDLMLRLGEQPGFMHIVAPPTYAKRDHPGSISKSLLLAFYGCKALLAQWQSGRYGISSRARTITRGMVGIHLRAAILALGRNHMPWRSMELYLRSFALNARIGRLRFLLGAPVIIGLGLISARGQR